MPARGCGACSGLTLTANPSWLMKTRLWRGDRPAVVLGPLVVLPVAPVVEFSDDAEVIRLANATEYGLVSYVYTRDLARGLRTAEALECGMVGLNRGLVSDPAAPFGGMKQSGVGREGGHQGLLEFTETKYIAVSW